MTWAAVLATALGCYLLMVAGLSVPERVLADPRIRRVAALLPVALLAALVAVQTFPEGIRLDARVAGVGAGALALALRAPFLVVVGVAALVAAGLRLLSG